ncbi:phosphatidylinositol 3-kinase regulatory subunit alpha-like [Protopterus annectens]|uniref:phosphatidylinositol 3-kinase regulatory subunit alpha-like n=1 Tax=Protopterus annectens TaxID=7888 RepID=UPI001CFA7A30|nr:phosphatidylinositol 3-kinase regulatory subunit alpha-like [Protopterus annectens]
MSVDMDKFDIHTIAEILKQYLLELPVPLISSSVYNELVCSAQEKQSLEECGQQIRKILDSASTLHQNSVILQTLTKHFCHLCQNNSKNFLTPKRIGEFYGDVLFKPCQASSNVTPEYRVKIIEALIAAGGVSEIRAGVFCPAGSGCSKGKYTMEGMRPESFLSV